ncbi:MAG: hypothetical protein H6677_25520 [Candidatus Obscuribacterales bacterium]|nr:hypothetical protein [Candidatus Obscuribacterales bacterium]
MIPQTVLTYWRSNHAPWSGDDQVEHFLKKMDDAAFREDILPLLREGVDYDFDSAARFVLDEVVSKLPGNPWKRPQ